MPHDWKVGETEFEIDVTTAKLEGKKDLQGNDVFLSYPSVRRKVKKKPGGDDQPWLMITDEGGIRPSLWSTPERARKCGEDFLDENVDKIP